MKGHGKTGCLFGHDVGRGIHAVSFDSYHYEELRHSTI